MNTAKTKSFQGLMPTSMAAIAALSLLGSTGWANGGHAGGGHGGGGNSSGHSGGFPASGGFQRGGGDFFHSEAFFSPNRGRGWGFYGGPYIGGDFYLDPYAPVSPYAPAQPPSPVAEGPEPPVAPPPATPAPIALLPAAEVPEALIKGDVVVNVQQALKAMGYYNGPVNGLSDTPTRMAIRAYSLKEGITPTGCIDKQLLTSLGLL